MMKKTYRPIVVDMTQLISNPLDMIRFKGSLELQDIVVSRSDCPLSDRLRNEEEVEQLISGNFGVNNSSGRRVCQTTSLFQEESLLDSFCHYHKHELSSAESLVRSSHV